MTQAQQRFIELDKKKDEIKKFYKEYDEAVQLLMQEDGMSIGEAFQDKEGTVYQLDIPKGTYVDFKQLTVNRTRREGERTGSLSLKSAKDLGYEVK